MGWRILGFIDQGISTALVEAMSIVLIQLAAFLRLGVITGLVKVTKSIGDEAR